MTDDRTEVARIIYRAMECEQPEDAPWPSFEENLARAHGDWSGVSGRFAEAWNAAGAILALEHDDLGNRNQSSGFGHRSSAQEPKAASVMTPSKTGQTL